MVENGPSGNLPANPPRVDFQPAGACRLNRATEHPPAVKELDDMWRSLREHELDSQVQLIRRAIFAPLAD
jgi:hypothetical protein